MRENLIKIQNFLEIKFDMKKENELEFTNETKITKEEIQEVKPKNYATYRNAHKNRRAETTRLPSLTQQGKDINIKSLFERTDFDPEAINNEFVSNIIDGEGMDLLKKSKIDLAYDKVAQEQYVRDLALKHMQEQREMRKNKIGEDLKEFEPEKKQEESKAPAKGKKGEDESSSD